MRMYRLTDPKMNMNDDEAGRPRHKTHFCLGNTALFAMVRHLDKRYGDPLVESERVEVTEHTARSGILKRTPWALSVHLDFGGMASPGWKLHELEFGDVELSYMPHHWDHVVESIDRGLHRDDEPLRGLCRILSWQIVYVIPRKLAVAMLDRLRGLEDQADNDARENLAKIGRKAEGKEPF